MNHTYDTFIKKVDILSKALEKSTDRTRSMLYVVTFFSVLILVTSFNAYLAWDRKINAHERVLVSQEFKLIPKASIEPFNNTLATELRRSNIQEYIDITNEAVNESIAKIIHDIQFQYSGNQIASTALNVYIRSLETNRLLLPQSDYFKLFLDRQKFTVPLIGLTCYADDLYLIGGIGLIILLTYSFFSVRRENRIVERIAKTVKYVEISDPKDYLHNHNYSEREVSLIKHNLLEYIFYGCVEFFIFNTGLTRKDYSTQEGGVTKDKTNSIGRAVLKTTYWLPIFAMCFALFFEVKSFVDRYHFINHSDHFELYFRYFIALAILITNIWQSRIINELNHSNSELIDEMYDTIKGSRERLGLE